MNKINVLYISIQGSTKHFVNKISQLFHNVDLHRITDQSDLFKINHPYFVFVPCYVHGNHDRYVEMDTLTMHDELSYADNYKRCLGVIGSGNRNFGVDCYCWTARYYCEIFHLPLIAEYELRGTIPAANIIDKKMADIWSKRTGEAITYHKHNEINPRLKKLEKKYGK